MGNNVFNDIKKHHHSQQQQENNYKKRLNSIFFSTANKSLTSSIDANKQEDTLYNLFKNYSYNQLQNLYLEYEYLELLKENFYFNFNLPRINYCNVINFNPKAIKFIKFYFVNGCVNLNEFIKIDAHVISNSCTSTGLFQIMEIMTKS